MIFSSLINIGPWLWLTFVCALFTNIGCLIIGSSHYAHLKYFVENYFTVKLTFCKPGISSSFISVIGMRGLWNRLFWRDYLPGSRGELSNIFLAPSGALHMSGALYVPILHKPHFCEFHSAQPYSVTTWSMQLWATHAMHARIHQLLPNEEEDFKNVSTWRSLHGESDSISYLHL